MSSLPLRKQGGRKDSEREVQTVLKILVGLQVILIFFYTFSYSKYFNKKIRTTNKFSTLSQLNNFKSRRKYVFLYFISSFLLLPVQYRIQDFLRGSWVLLLSPKSLIITILEAAAIYLLLCIICSNILNVTLKHKVTVGGKMHTILIPKNY